MCWRGLARASALRRVCSRKACWGEFGSGSSGRTPRNAFGEKQTALALPRECYNVGFSKRKPAERKLQGHSGRKQSALQASYTLLPTTHGRLSFERRVFPQLPGSFHEWREDMESHPRLALWRYHSAHGVRHTEGLEMIPWVWVKIKPGDRTF